MFAFKYAVKSIFRRKQKNIMTAIAIGLGVALFIGTQAASNGVYNTMVQLNLDNMGNEDIVINNPTSEIGGLFNGSVVAYIQTHLSEPVYSDVTSISSRISYYTSVYDNSTGLLEKNVGIKGINPNDQGFGDFYDLQGSRIELSSVITANRIIISNTLRQSLELDIGSVVQINVPDGKGNATTVQLEVDSIYDDRLGRGKVGSIGDNPIPQLYVNIETLQMNFASEYQNFLTDIRITLNGIDRSPKNFDFKDKSFPGKTKVESVLRALSDLLILEYPDLFVFSPIVQLSDTIYDDLSGISAVLTLFAIILNGVALLLIINVQTMAVDDRKSQTAILRALGSSTRTVFTVFLIEAVLVGVVGALIGFAIGLMISIWILNILVEIFNISNGVGAGITSSLLITSMLTGILLSIITAVSPALKAARQSISDSLRGLEEHEGKEKRGYKAIIFGVFLLVTGLNASMSVGDLTNDRTWSNMDDQVTIAYAFGLTLAGFGLILTLFVSRKIALSISGASLFGLGIFFFTWAIRKGKTGDGSYLFTIILLYMIVGSTTLVSLYYQEILEFIKSILFTVTGFRAIGQVTTTSMLGKKNRGVLVYTILTVILVLTIFIASAAETQRYSVVSSYDRHSLGIDIVVTTDAKVEGTQERIATINQRNTNIAEVENVFAFRRAMMPIYLVHPLSDNFDKSTDITYLPIIEVPENQVNPDNWGIDSLPIRFYDLSEEISKETGQKVSIKTTDSEHRIITSSTFDIFYNSLTRERVVTISEDENQISMIETQQMIIGGFALNFRNVLLTTGATIYIQGINNEIIPVFIGATTYFDMMGEETFPLYGDSVIVTPNVGAKLPFDSMNPNLFLVRSSNGYSDDEKNEILAKAIAQDINNLNDPESFSSLQVPVTLIGASSTLVHKIVKEYFFQQAAFWDFLGAFSTIGLVIGTLGMMIIAVRSVSERTREIGMMRSIGFSRKSVVYGVLIEMIILSLLSLFVGLTIAIIFSESFATNVFGVKALYPFAKIFGYTFGLLGLAIISGAIPGYRASQVAPSQALRYTG